MGLCGEVVNLGDGWRRRRRKSWGSMAVHEVLVLSVVAEI